MTTTLKPSPATNATHQTRNIPQTRFRSACIVMAMGCSRSEMKTARLFPYFEANGLEICNRIQDADMVIVTTCGVEVRSEKRSLAMLDVVDRLRKPESTLVVIGCLAAINRPVVEDSIGDVVVMSNLEDLDEMIGAEVGFGDIPDGNDVTSQINEARETLSKSQRVQAQWRCYNFSELVSLIWQRVVARLRKQSGMGESSGPVYSLRISNGCLDECSYCAIRFSEGTLTSKPLLDIMTEFRKGLEQGYRHFRIVSTDAGCYGLDIGTNIVELLEAIFDCPDDFTITMPGLHPRWLLAGGEHLMDIMARNSHRMKKICIPLQSGSDRILTLMQRQYSIAEATDSMSKLRERCPNIQLLTEVIVGFPSETEDDFDATIRAIQLVRPDKVNVYRYADRPNTIASQIRDKVSEATIDKRAKRLWARTSGCQWAR